MKYGENVTQIVEYTWMPRITNRKKYIMKHKKITEMEIEEIKREMQASQRSHLEAREGEELAHTVTTKDDEQKPSEVFTAEEETEIYQNKDQIYKLKEN